MRFKHANTSLLKAIALAGSQLDLAGLLEVHPSQVSAWLHNPNVNMPYKYGAVIEKWSAGTITTNNLFPNVRNTTEVSPDKITALSLEMLIKQAEDAGVPLLISISLGSNAHSEALSH